MKFGPVALERAAGKILAHNIGGNKNSSFRKGIILTADDVNSLREQGYSTVYVAETEPGDVDEGSAARRIAEACLGPGLRIQGGGGGRVSLAALYPGVLRVDADRLELINMRSGIAFATLRTHSLVKAGEICATVKIIPYSFPEIVLEQVEKLARGNTKIIQLLELKPKKVGLLLSGSPGASSRVIKSFTGPLRRRIETLGSQVEVEDFVPLTGIEDEARLADSMRRMVDRGIDLLVMASETSTMDGSDIAPSAVSRAGGRVICIGAPVDPGNLLLLADLHGVPLLGAPGCARSSQDNIVDHVLPVLLAGDQFSQADIARLGHGGLLVGEGE
jgi:molybdopterin biosynthesis enzyme